MSETEQNLKDAFAGESQANRRYLAFAYKAEKDGFPDIARLFRVAAESETIHALNHLKTMEVVKTTIENLKEATEGESLQIISMYPKFIEEAEVEGNQAAAESFQLAFEREKHHRAMFQQALKKLEK